MRHIREIDEFGARYADASLEPLIVRAVMVANSPVTYHPDEPIRLDGILAWSVVKHALAGGLPDDDPEPVWVPLPVECAWRSESGQPLWSASALFPVGEQFTQRLSFTKRVEFRFSHRKYRENAGRWMSRMKHVYCLTTDAFEARVIGNREYIEKLLEPVGSIGKHRRRGFGEVARWEVVPLEFDPREVFVFAGVLTRELPAAAAEIAGLDRRIMPPVITIGWTPPYWLPANRADGWRVGTTVGGSARGAGR